jgi:hypothetical protein
MEKLLLMEETACYERTREAHYFSVNSSKLLDTPNVACMRRGRRKNLRLRLATDSSIRAITSLPHTNFLIYDPNSRLTIACKLVTKAIKIFTGYLAFFFFFCSEACKTHQSESWTCLVRSGRKYSGNVTCLDRRSEGLRRLVLIVGDSAFWGFQWPEGQRPLNIG